MSDIELLRLWKEGNEGAFAVFYKKSVRGLVQIALEKTGDRLVAEELVQDAYLSFYQHKSDSLMNPGGYLRVILKNKIIDYYRKDATRRSHALLKPSAVEAVVPSPETKLINKQQDELLIEAIESLPPNCGKVFKLRRLYDLSNQEVANQLGISVNTVEQHMRKAIKRLVQMGLMLALALVGLGR